MKKNYCLLFLFFVMNNVFGRTNTDTLFEHLKVVIDSSSIFDAQKVSSINNLKKELASISSEDALKKIDVTSKLYEAFKTFNYDSALLYAKNLQKISFQLNDKARIVDAKIKLSFILISAGLYKDAFDSLHTINVYGYADSIKSEYYSLMGRSFYDLGDFNNDNFYTSRYYEKGNIYLDSALHYFPSNSFQYAYYKGLRFLKMGDITNAQSVLENIVNRVGLSLHEKALAESTLSGIYGLRNYTSKQISLLMMAAIDDIKSSTKETTATLYLASLLFKRNQLRPAFVCVEKSIQDAIFYGARQRQVQVSAILPIIEGARVNAIDNQRHILFLYAAAVTILLVILFFLIFLVYRQNKNLKKAKQIISEANAKQQIINHQLSEANKIKEEYMVHSYNMNADFIAKIERLRNTLERKMNDRKYEEIKFLLNNVNLKAEKEEMLIGFDKVFLKLFPDFVEVFNSMFKEEDKLHLNEDGSMNTGLRIFALIRMGITDNDKIAQILEYSVNTIYTYKTKFKKKAIVSPKEFDEIVMQSKAF